MVSLQPSYWTIRARKARRIYVINWSMNVTEFKRLPTNHLTKAGRTMELYGNLKHFCSSLRLKDFATCPCSQSQEYSPAHSKILPSTPKSSKWSFSFMFLHHNTIRTSFLPMRATCTAHLFLLDLIALIIFGTNRKVTVSKSRCVALFDLGSSWSRRQKGHQTPQRSNQVQAGCTDCYIFPDSSSYDLPHRWACGKL